MPKKTLDGEDNIDIHSIPPIHLDWVGTDGGVTGILQTESGGTSVFETNHNTFFSGPTTGVAAPAFRTLDATDATSSFAGAIGPLLSPTYQNTLDRITALEEAEPGTDTRIDQLETDVATLQTDVTALDGEITTLQGEVVTLQGQVTGLETSLAAVTLTADGAAAGVAALTVDLAITNSNVSSLTSSLATTNSNVSTLTTNLATTNSNVTAIQNWEVTFY